MKNKYFETIARSIYIYTSDAGEVIIVDAQTDKWEETIITSEEEYQTFMAHLRLCAKELGWKEAQ